MYNPEEQKDRNYRHLYGISLETYREMYASQNGRCVICRTYYAVLCVDHDHITGQIRGLLCRRCNGCLGFVEKWSMEIDKYLRQHSSIG